MSKYNYLNLKEINEKKECFFYGIIVDATFPAKEETDDAYYVCTIKLIDNNINFTNDPIEIANHMVYVTVKSDLIQYLPFIRHVGDILRVHRGIYVSNIFIFKISNLFKQLHINMIFTLLISL